MDTQRDRTAAQVAAIDILKRLDPQGIARGKIREFVLSVPPERAVELARSLASYCETKEKPALALSHAVREGYAREIAEGGLEARQERASGRGASSIWADIHDRYGHPKQLSDMDYKRRLRLQQTYLESRRWSEDHNGVKYDFVPEWTPDTAEACYSNGKQGRRSVLQEEPGDAGGVQEEAQAGGPGAGRRGTAGPEPSEAQEANQSHFQDEGHLWEDSLDLAP